MYGSPIVFDLIEMVGPTYLSPIRTNNKNFNKLNLNIELRNGSIANVSKHA